MNFGKFAVKLLGNSGYIKCILEFLTGAQHRKSAAVVVFLQIDEQTGEFGKKQIARLPPDKRVFAHGSFAAVSLRPIPQHARALFIDEEQKIFVKLPGNRLVNGAARFDIGEFARANDLQGGNAAQLRDFLYRVLDLR